MISIGFPSTKKVEGPKVFLSRLRDSIERNRLARTTSFINPFHDIDVFASYARPIYGKPYVIRIDGIHFDSMDTGGSIEEKNRDIFRSIDRSSGIVFQSEFNRKLVESIKGGIDTRYAILQNGINLEEFRPDGYNHKAELGIDSSAKVLVTSAAWRDHKRLDCVIEVFRQLYSEDKDYHLVILGGGQEKLPHFPNMHCVGFIPPTDLPAWYRTGDVFIFLSWLDSCPNTVIEAIACGLPVVCTNQGGTREIVENSNGGVVVESDEPFSFRPIDLYNPPPVDRFLVASTVKEVFTSLQYYRNKIDFYSVDIHRTSREYVTFIETCFSNKNN